MSYSEIQAKKEITFVEHHLPSLKAGKYEFKFSQQIKIQDKVSAKSFVASEDFSAQRIIHILGEQYSFNPQLIYAIFPAEGSRGSFQNILPHIILKRSTLPWERETTATYPIPEIKNFQTDSKTKSPWLALLLFHEGEVANSELTDIEVIASQLSEPPLDPKEQISLITISQNLLEKILPTGNELKFLTHIRQGVHEDGESLELAVMVGNRLPKANQVNTVHLVSLENIFKVNQTPDEVKKVSLVTLRSWSFFCDDENKQDQFESILTQLNQPKLEQATQSVPWTFHLSLRNNSADDYLQHGYVALKHHLRNTQKTVSWYRSPLLPGLVSLDYSLPTLIKSADQLFVFESSTGLFNISYGAAWQLGRLLALTNTSFSNRLFAWKRHYKQQYLISGRSPNVTINPLQLLLSNGGRGDAQNNSLDLLIAWLKEICLLKHIPFNYLVPDPELLPVESIRFFALDNTWINCLINGAIALGDDANTEKKYCENYQETIRSKLDQPSVPITGFIIHSEAIAYFPSLEIKGKDKANNSLEILRLDRLGTHVMLCLFRGEVDSVTLNQKAEILHFGLETKKDTFFIQLRDPNTAEFLGEQLILNPTHWRHRELNILAIAPLVTDLARQIKEKIPSFAIDQFRSGQFAIELIEGSPIISCNCST